LDCKGGTFLEIKLKVKNQMSKGLWTKIFWNLNGIHRINNFNANNPLNISELTPGVYFARIIFGNNQ
jgi:hypothetical protein